MGLDMYLTKEHFIGAKYERRNVKGECKISVEGKPLDINFNQISVIKEEVAYWRKANQIHKWFVDNIQDGEDNCEESLASYGKLMELVDLCKKVIETKDPSLLPPEEGFFFGGTEIDDYYYENLKYTIEMLENIDPKGDYSYRASW